MLAATGAIVQDIGQFQGTDKLVGSAKMTVSLSRARALSLLSLSLSLFSARVCVGLYSVGVRLLSVGFT